MNFANLAISSEDAGSQRFVEAGHLTDSWSSQVTDRGSGQPPVNAD
jgi:hypothetical protein